MDVYGKPGDVYGAPGGKYANLAATVVIVRSVIQVEGHHVAVREAVASAVSRVSSSGSVVSVERVG